MLHYLDAVRLEAGGVVRAVLDLVAALSSAGARVTLLTGDAADAPAAWLGGTAAAPSVVTVHRPRWPFPPSGGARSALEQAVGSVDVVHLHQPWDPFNPCVARVCCRLGRPYVLSAHGMLDDWSMGVRRAKKRLYLALEGRRMLRGAHAVHYTADAERDQGSKWAHGARSFVAPLVMDLAPFFHGPGPEVARARFSTALSGPGPRLLFLGRVDPKKGIDLLIEAVATLQREGVVASVVVAGPGPEHYVSELQGLARERGVSEQFHFVGMARDEAKLSLYRACDAFVLPSHQENFGIVLVEAMASGLPVVTTDKVDIWRELEGLGATIVQDQAESLADGLRALLADLPGAKRRAHHSSAGLAEWLDPRRVVAQYLTLYHGAIARFAT